MASSLLRIMCTYCVIILLGSMDWILLLLKLERDSKLVMTLVGMNLSPTILSFTSNGLKGTYRFHVGDSLIFVYQNDSVLTVDKKEYFNCDTSKPITAFDNGMSILNLDKSGPFYFISGTKNHCTNGQKLLVDPFPKSSPPPFASDDTLQDSISASTSMVLSPLPMASMLIFVLVFFLCNDCF